MVQGFLIGAIIAVALITLWVIWDEGERWY